MREPTSREVVRKVKITNGEMVVTVEESADNIHAAVEDALPGANSIDYEIEEAYTVETYGNEQVIGEDND